MPEQVELTGEIELRVSPNGLLYFDLPTWFIRQTGRVSVMTPYATSIVTSKVDGSIAPFHGDFTMVGRHYVWPERMEYREIRHENLHPDKLRIKPWGEDERIYRIVVNDERGNMEGGDVGGD